MRRRNLHYYKGHDSRKLLKSSSQIAMVNNVFLTVKTTFRFLFYAFYSVTNQVCPTVAEEIHRRH